MKSITTLSAAVALLSGAANAFFRMECDTRSGLARLDPIVEPGVIANHGHAVFGGSNFGMSSTYEDLVASECTSCRVKQDKSAYWTPSLNFIHENGTTEVVPQSGGMLAYYLLMGDNIKAFPAGFQMLAGDTRQRNFTGPFPDKPKSEWGPEDTTQESLGQKAIGFNCLNYKKDAEGSMYRHFLPDKAYLEANCADGIRAEIFFPSCWNGKDVDSPNHKDHLKYPNLVNDGKCPEGFETRVPSIFFETIWNTAVFNGIPGQFVFSNGDPTGYGYHGDLQMGWDVDFLQNVINTCTNPSGRIEDCPLFEIQSREESGACEFKVPKMLAADNCNGPAEGLCGNVPIQAGPAYAELIAPGNEETPTAGYTPETTLGPLVPTLSFQTATLAVTDKWGGGINVGENSEVVGEIQTGVDAVPVPTAVAPEPTPLIPEVPVPVPTAVVPEPTPIIPEAPVVTSAAVVAPVPTAPPADPPVDGDGSIISTSTFTSAGVVYEVAVEEVTVYVTVDAAVRPKRLRRHHHHHRRDREHGLLGRY